MYVIDSLARGGAERSLASLAPQYRQLGVRLDVVVLVERDGVEAAIRSAGGEIFSVAGATGRTARVRQLTALMRERSPDLVHTTLFESDVAGRVSARIARLPVVSSLVNEVYGPEHLSEPGIRRSRLAAARALDATTARLAIRMHAVSEPCRGDHGPPPRLSRVANRRRPSRVATLPRSGDVRLIGARPLEQDSAQSTATSLSSRSGVTKPRRGSTSSSKRSRSFVRPCPERASTSPGEMGTRPACSEPRSRENGWSHSSRCSENGRTSPSFSAQLTYSRSRPDRRHARIRDRSHGTRSPDRRDGASPGSRGDGL